MLVRVFCHGEVVRPAGGDPRVATLLRDYTGRECLVNYTAKGEPTVAGGIYLSISHSKGLMAAAVADAPLGVDIERVRSAPMVVARRFCKEEQSYVAVGGDRNFFQVWTRKEAILKAKGIGLAGGLDSFAVASGVCLLPQAAGYFLYTTEVAGAMLSIAFRNPIESTLSVEVL